MSAIYVPAEVTVEVVDVNIDNNNGNVVNESNKKLLVEAERRAIWKIRIATACVVCMTVPLITVSLVFLIFFNDEIYSKNLAKLFAVSFVIILMNIVVGDKVKKMFKCLFKGIDVCCGFTYEMTQTQHCDGKFFMMLWIVAIICIMTMMFVDMGKPVDTIGFITLIGLYFIGAGVIINDIYMSAVEVIEGHRANRHVTLHSQAQPQIELIEV